MMVKRTGRPRIDYRVEAELRRLIRDGVVSSAAQAAKALEAHFAGQQVTVPQERTIRKYFSQIAAIDQSEAWGLNQPSARPDYLLAVLRAAAELSEGRIVRLTQREARWLDTLAEAVADLPPGTALRWARTYVLTEPATEALDYALAQTPTEAEALVTNESDADEREALMTRIWRHVDSHAARWPDQPLAVWTRGSDWIRFAYIDKAQERGGYMIEWDNRPGVYFLQVRVKED